MKIVEVTLGSHNTTVCTEQLVQGKIHFITSTGHRAKPVGADTEILVLS